MKKFAGIFLLLAIIGSGTAQAQIAVPELVPAAPKLILGRDAGFAMQTSITPENPAALQWGAPGRLAAGAISGSSNNSVPGLEGDITGSFGGFRLVGEMVAIALESANFSLDSLVSPAEEKTASFVLSFSGPDWLSYGFSLENRDFEVDNAGVATTLETGGKTAGISLRMGKVFYLGLALGTENLTATTLGISADRERDVQMAGIAYRSGGDWIWRLEASVLNKDPYQDALGVQFDGYDMSQVAVETELFNILLGYTAFNLKGTGSIAGVEVKGFIIDYGIAPLLGLTLTGRFEGNKLINAAGIKVVTEQIHSLAIAWQF